METLKHDDADAADDGGDDDNYDDDGGDYIDDEHDYGDDDTNGRSLGSLACNIVATLPCKQHWLTCIYFYQKPRDSSAYGERGFSLRNLDMKLI
eukprot:4556838-Karenia_brevis.AAC.1